MRFRRYLSEVLYHGTTMDRYQKIKSSGFTPSKSGFGGMMISGVGLTSDYQEAAGYAWAYSDMRKKEPVVIETKVKRKNFMNLVGVRNHLDVWKKLGLNWKDEEGLKQIKKYIKNNSLVLTELLMELGYDGALVDNTLGKMYQGTPEIVVFEPKNIKILGVLDAKI